MYKWKIAVVDDDLQDALYLINELNKISKHLDITRFQNGESIIKEFYQGMFDIIFLDIYMGGINGIETARRIREKDEYCSIVFVTTSAEHALEGYRVHAEDYIIKPIKSNDLSILFQHITHTHMVDPALQITTDRQKKDIPFSEILYVDVLDKTCRVHTTDDMVVVHTSIEEINKQLNILPFLRCHRSFIVNMNHIKNMEKDFYMKNGDVVYVRQSEYNKMRRIYMEYLMEKTRKGGK